MSTGRKAHLVAWISGGCLAVVAMISVGVVAITHAGAEQAATGSLVGAGISPAPSVTPTVLPVPALHSLTPPDVVVTLRKAAGASAVEHLRALPGVRSVALADRGSIRLGHVRLHVLGVPLATIRGFTPSLTASSTALWHSVARGEITVGYANSRPLTHRLGATLVAHGGRGSVAPIRIGAFATIGLPGGQALVSKPAARTLGLAPGREVLIAAPKLSLDALRRDVRTIFGANARVQVTRAAPVDQSVSSAYAQSMIPPTYLALYRRAAVTCPGLPWTILAGVGTVETGNGRDVHRSIAGAEGPMQFLPSTWAIWGYDADGDGKANIQDPVDAIFSAARYLCAAGAGRGGQSLDDAIYAYNHAWWYVREVIVIANQYA
jgi:Transglycosylase SLT domain